MSSCRWIPWALGGALGIVVVVNAAMAVLAVNSSPGLVSAHAFENGNAYNRVLEAAADEDRLGWRGEVRVTAQARHLAHVQVALSDRFGQPLTGLDVVSAIISPVEPLPVVQLPLSEIAAGRYGAEARLARSGQWDVHISARRGSERYHFTQRIIVR